MPWGNPVELETRARIQIAVAAYAYEMMSNPLIDDATFDAAAKQIDLSIDTSRPDLDRWFREHFSPHTGQWIHNHPELHKIAQLYRRLISRTC
jgi:hypothetical protein